MSQEQQQQHASAQADEFAKTLHNTALFAIIACPALALLPPRKLDIYTLGLIGVTGYSANYLIAESSGRTIWQHVSRQPGIASTKIEPEQRGVLEEVQKEARGARETWKMQRRKEIAEDVEEGKGFGDMIMEQIWEVWNQGKTKEEEDD